MKNNKTDSKKLNKIKKILNKANRDFLEVEGKFIKGEYVVDYDPKSKKEIKRMEHNFVIYAQALEDIGNIIYYKEPEIIGLYKKLKNRVSLKLLKAIIKLSEEIAVIGSIDREKAVGTGFVIGNKTDFSKFTKPILKKNYLKSIPKKERNIQNASFRQAVKEFSNLDGIFLVDKKGTVLDAGVYVNIEKPKHLLGLGMRNRCVAELSRRTKAIGITVSKRNGLIRVFKDGKAYLRRGEK